MTIDSVNKSLSEFAGTEFAEAALIRGLPSDFSRARLLDDLAGYRVRLPVSPLRDRMLGEPEFLVKPVAEARVREWEVSRCALVTAFQRLEARGVDFAEVASRLRFSFSHTEGVALAMVAVFPSSGGFGVDLESLGREISDAAFARFHRPSELSLLSDRLDHWVLKEAAYKAHPRSAETVVSDFEITGRGPGEDEILLTCRKGATETFRARLGTLDEFRYAFAVPLD
jgi:phosphopantetheinyl transferase (holo-ACP synthase)